MRRNNCKGQVAVEFLFMFIIVVSMIIYAFYFSFSLSSLHYRTYETFMIGRAILSSSPKYSDKANRAEQVKASFESSDAVKNSITSGYQCDLSLGRGGFRGIMNYGYSDAAFDVVTNAGIACSVTANFVLPYLLPGNNSNNLKLGIESMTGSEISDEHCNCLRNPKQTWRQCLDEHPGQTGLAPIDNGC